MTEPQTNPDRADLAARLQAASKDEGPVYYGVVTTGIYCKPDCPARAPKPENIRIFTSVAEAEAQGFRACKRCHPRGEDAAVERAIRACHIMAASDTPPKLSELANIFGLSTFQFQRSFKAVLGLSPKDYAAALRKARLASALHQSPTITEALYDAGYGSAARFYEEATALLGMSPAAHRAGGIGEEVRFAIAQTELGALLVAATARGVCKIALADEADALVRQVQDSYPNAALSAGDAGFDQWVAAVLASVEEPGKAKDLPLDIRGTAFQQRVWKALRAIPLGQTRTYSMIAKAIGRPKAVRAVASACAANTHALAIPCHRVIRTDGALGGYRWGIDRKRALLLMEKAAAERKG